MRELVTRGVGPETARQVVSEFLAEVPEEELARRVLEKLPGSGEEWMRRAARRLVSRGFRASLALRMAGHSDRDEVVDPEEDGGRDVDSGRDEA